METAVWRWAAEDDLFQQINIYSNILFGSLSNNTNILNCFFFITLKLHHSLSQWFPTWRWGIPQGVTSWIYKRLQVESKVFIFTSSGKIYCSGKKTSHKALRKKKDFSLIAQICCVTWTQNRLYKNSGWACLTIKKQIDKNPFQHCLECICYKCISSTWEKMEQFWL